MSIRYDKLTTSLKDRLPAERLEILGRATSFIRRLRQISASTFVWSVVLSRFGQGTPGFEHARQWFNRLTDSEVWPRPFQMRFKAEAAVKLLAASFEEAVKPWRGGGRGVRHRLARRFPDVVAWDSTPVHLADSLRSHFRGLRSAPSQMKVQLAISLFGLLPLAARLVSQHISDHRLGPPLELFRKRTLLLFDRGFSAYQHLRIISEAQLFYLCPLHSNSRAHVVGVHAAPMRVQAALRRQPEGVELSSLLTKHTRVRKVWDLDVMLTPTGHGHDPTPFRARLLIMPGPKGKQRRYVTNLGARWSPGALRELYRLRWQVELVFKELKQHLNLESVPTKDPNAAQVFVWASLLALAVSRTVAVCLTPRSQLVGLAADIRPAVLTRALRAMIRLFARLLAAPPEQARELAMVLAEELWEEAHQRATSREDSFKRLAPMLPTDNAA